MKSTLLPHLTKYQHQCLSINSCSKSITKSNNFDQVETNANSTIYQIRIQHVPTREMRPIELLKSSSSSFGREGYWMMSWDPSRPRASPSALGLGQTPNGGGTCEGTPTLKSVKRVINILVGEQ